MLIARDVGKILFASFVGWAKAHLRRAHHFLKEAGGHAEPVISARALLRSSGARIRATRWLCPPYSARRKRPRPPAGELTEAAFYIASRLKTANSDVGALKRFLERQQHVHHLRAVARLLHVVDLASAAIGDAGLRDL